MPPEATAGAGNKVGEVPPPEAFYLPAGDGRYLPTRATESPWDADSQHGGPPAALLGACIERTTGAPGLRLSRITVEFLRPVPQLECTVETHIARPGRRVAMTEATLSVDGVPAVLARAWHVAVEEEATRSVPPALSEVPALPPPVDGDPFPLLSEWGYGKATEWRFTGGAFGTPGPAAAWTRVRIPLIAGEELAPYQRALIVADSANGISSELPFDGWLFIPPGVTVNLVRHPATEWVYLSAKTHLGPDGTGLTLGELADVSGLVGTVSQPLLVAPR
jgi:hypothetical protein